MLDEREHERLTKLARRLGPLLETFRAADVLDDFLSFHDLNEDHLREWLLNADYTPAEIDAAYQRNQELMGLDADE